MSPNNNLGENMSEEINVVKNGARLLGETFITPGASLLANGQVGNGLLHVGAGIVARMFLGVPGMMLVAANSYSKTVTGKHVLAHFTGPASVTPVAAPVVVPAASAHVVAVAPTATAAVGEPTSTEAVVLPVAAEHGNASHTTHGSASQPVHGKGTVRNHKNES
jgi:hypothetical protein